MRACRQVDHCEDEDTEPDLERVLPAVRSTDLLGVISDPFETDDLVIVRIRERNLEYKSIHSLNSCAFSEVDDAQSDVLHIELWYVSHLNFQDLLYDS